MAARELSHTAGVSAQEQTFTPGPWGLTATEPPGQWVLYSQSARVGATAQCQDAGRYLGSAANARLIAAAPELLAALQRLIPLNINLDHPGLADDVTVPCDVTLGELRAARDAIIKAGG